jgi:hypothetical protein
VIVDDVHLVDLSSGPHFYRRSGYFNAILMDLCSYAIGTRKIMKHWRGRLDQIRASAVLVNYWLCMPS